LKELESRVETGWKVSEANGDGCSQVESKSDGKYDPGLGEAGKENKAESQHPIKTPRTTQKNTPNR